MASPQPLSRACRGCNQLKVRCQPSVVDPSACERCLHAGRECVPADKRRRPRDRIAELEAQVAALSRALQKQKLTTGSDASESSRGDGEPRPSGGAAAADAYSFAHDRERSTGEAVLAFLDARVPLATQQQALDLYTRRCLPIVPAYASACDSDLAALRRGKPAMLFTIVTFTAAHLLPSDDVRDALLHEAMCMFAVELISQPNRNLDTVWSLLIACFWFRARPGSAHASLHQLAQMAMGMAIDLGIGGALVPAAPGSGAIFPPDTSCPSNSSAQADAQRAWLACFMSASNLAIGIRRPDANVQWTRHHDHCLEQLSQLPLPPAADEAAEADRTLFLHLVRGERLCQRVAEAAHLCESAYQWDLTSEPAQRVVAEMQADIDNWTAETCSGPGGGAVHHHRPLLFYRYSAVIYLHESVLHTATNKLTFGAPFRPSKIAEHDFAAPAVVTGKHVASLYALRAACHAMLDLATTDPSMPAFLADCPLTYVAKVFQAAFVLAKLYVALTGPGNTYGAILRPDELHVAQYPERIGVLAAEIQERNPGSYNGHIFACCGNMRGWLATYDAGLAAAAAAAATDSSPSLSVVDELTPPDEYGEETTAATNAADVINASDDMAVYLTAYDTGGFDVDEIEWQMLDKYLNSYNNT